MIVNTVDALRRAAERGEDIKLTPSESQNLVAVIDAARVAVDAWERDKSIATVRSAHRAMDQAIAHLDRT